MITRIEGQLVAIDDAGQALLQCGGMTYAVLLAEADRDAVESRIGETVSFHTLHYLEAQGQGTAFVPRLIGFADPSARAFFELFTTVKGIGRRKALRALIEPAPAVAEAIATNNLAFLTSLPEIGRRTAQTIVAELGDKVDRFIEIKMNAGETPVSGPVPTERAAVARNALAVLTQLGEPATTSRELIQRALSADPTLESVDAVVEAAFRLKD